MGVLALAVAVCAAGCGGGSSSTSAPPGTSAASESNAAAGVARHHAEEFFERHGLDDYIAYMNPSTVRFIEECPPARSAQGAVIAGRWSCAGWGLVASAGGEGKPGQCQLVEGDATAAGLVGKPTGPATDFAGSACQQNAAGLGQPGKRPNPDLVAEWTSKQQAKGSP